MPLPEGDFDAMGRPLARFSLQSLLHAVEPSSPELTEDLALVCWLGLAAASIFVQGVLLGAVVVAYAVIRQRAVVAFLQIPSLPATGYVGRIPARRGVDSGSSMVTKGRPCQVVDHMGLRLVALAWCSK